MYVLLGESTNPYFNLAMEEYFLKEKDDDFFMLWRNDKSVIIGKNQNAYAEINHEYVNKNNIKVVRRMTGGGAVFHDLGNVNYTFVKRNSKDSFNDYKLFSEPIISFLKTLGVDARMSGRNDMLIGDKKFSGNAQCAYKDSVMHHGTLMFSAKKNNLSNSLNVNPLKIQSKGIASVRSRVTNISEHLDFLYIVEEFVSELYKYILSNFEGSKCYRLTNEDIERINELVEKKYSSSEWNYGFKQEYSIINEKKFDYGIIQANINVVNNKIVDLKFYGDFFGKRDITEIEKRLTGVTYLYDSVKEILYGLNIEEYVNMASLDDILTLLF